MEISLASMQAVRASCSDSGPSDLVLIMVIIFWIFKRQSDTICLHALTIYYAVKLGPCYRVFFTWANKLRGTPVQKGMDVKLSDTCNVPFSLQFLVYLPLGCFESFWRFRVCGNLEHLSTVVFANTNATVAVESIGPEAVDLDVALGKVTEREEQPQAKDALGQHIEHSIGNGFLVDTQDAAASSKSPDDWVRKVQGEGIDGNGGEELRNLRSACTGEAAGVEQDLVGNHQVREDRDDVPMIVSSEILKHLINQKTHQPHFAVRP
jgi:hypothetical protein